MHHFGDYELLHEIARGGMGVVYKARQISLNRIVAVKMLLFGKLAGGNFIKRFRAEAEAAASLQHPNIVAIHEVGEHEGQQYFTMDYVEGTDLAALVHEKPLPAKRAAAYLKAIAEAIRCAHGKGILHRDLKPSNILIDELDQPRVTDFGLAKRLPGSELEPRNGDLTLTGQVLGTPYYMPPEQADGKRGTVGEAGDVYALGAILYHLLVGHPPFVADTLEAALAQLLHNDPVPPRLLNANVPRDLETICLKCLQKEPRRRYTTAGELAQELGRFLDGASIHARPIGPAEKVWRWCRRKPALASTVVALHLALALGLAGILWQWRRAEQNASTAVQQSSRAEHNAAAQAIERARAEQSLHRLEIQRAQEMLAQDNAGPALAYLARELRRNPGNQGIASWVMSALSLRDFPLPIHRPLRHDAILLQTQFSPNGRSLLTSARDGKACLWNVATGKLIKEWQHGKPAKEMHLYAAFDLRGNRVLTAAHDGLARVWDATTGEPLTPFMNHGAPIEQAEFSPDGLRVATAGREGNTACVWDAQTGARLVPPLQHRGIVWMVRFSPDGERLATASNDPVLRLWDSRSGQPVGAPIAAGGQTRWVEFSPDGTRLAIASHDHHVYMVDSRAGAAQFSPLLHDDIVTIVHFSRDGRRLLSVSGNTVQIWDAITGQSLMAPIRHNAKVWAAQFSPDGMRIVTACWNRTARVWNSVTGEPVGEPMHHDAGVHTVEFSPDGAMVATGSWDATAQIWNVQPRRIVAAPLRHPAPVADADFSPDGRQLATLGVDGSCRIWDAVTAQPVIPMTNFQRRGWSVHFSPDNHRLAATFLDTNAILADTSTGVALDSILAHSREVRFATFSKDGRFVVTGADDGTARIWKSQTGEAMTGYLRHSNEVLCAEFSPDGSRLATGASDEYARIWETQTGRLMARTAAHHERVVALQFSPDGSRLATASWNRAARIWDAKTGAPLTDWLKHDFTVILIQFSRDGRRLYTFTEQGALRAWNADTGEAITEIIPPNQEVLAAQFSRLGDRVATVGADYGVRVFDVATGLPLIETLHQSERPLAVRFSPDARRLAVASGDATRVWELPVVEGSAPPWLPELAEAVGGWRISSNGVLQAVSTREIGILKSSFAKLTGDDSFTDWGKRYFSPYRTRSIQPGSPLRGRDFTPRLTRENHPENWRFLWAQHPDQPGLAAGIVRFDLEHARVRGSAFLTEADYLSSGMLSLAPHRLDLLDARAEVNDRLGYEQRFLTRPDAMTTAMAEFRDARYWLVSAGRYASLGNWTKALERCERALAAASGASDTIRPSPIPKEPANLTTNDWPQVQREARFLRAQVLWRLGRTSEAKIDHDASRFIPARSVQASLRQLDLTSFYNARLDDDWHLDKTPVPQCTLETLPTGLQDFDKITFDVRGLIQLGGPDLRLHGRNYPERIIGIPVGQQCRRIHFLHATVYSVSAGEVLAEYAFRYANGKTSVMPIRYGGNVADWWVDSIIIPDEGQSYRVAWKGANDFARSRRVTQRLYHAIWENPRPEVPVTSLDLVSHGLGATPFIVAITVEP